MNAKLFINYRREDTRHTAGDLAIDGTGNLFAASSSRSIFKFTPDGKKSTFATGTGLSGMAVDAATTFSEDLLDPLWRKANQVNEK